MTNIFDNPDYDNVAKLAALEVGAGFAGLGLTFLAEKSIKQDVLLQERRANDAKHVFDNLFKMDILEKRLTPIHDALPYETSLKSRTAAILMKAVNSEGVPLDIAQSWRDLKLGREIKPLPWTSKQDLLGQVSPYEIARQLFSHEANFTSAKHQIIAEAIAQRAEKHKIPAYSSARDMLYAWERAAYDKSSAFRVAGVALPMLLTGTLVGGFELVKYLKNSRP